MPTLCRAYVTHDHAQAAVDRLLAAGIAVSEIRVLTGEPEQDQRNEPIGQFAHGEAAGTKPVGSFAGTPGASSDTMGAFAGAREQQRRGSFGDLDRDTVTTYADGVPRVIVASHRNLTRLLVDAGLDQPTAEADVKALHHGRILVLVQTSSSTSEDATGALDAVEVDRSAGSQ